MNRLPIAAAAAAAAALSLSLPAQASSIALFGDKDCFGSNALCAEGSSLAHWGMVRTGSADPAPTDRRMSSPHAVTWTMHFAPGSYADALVLLRTAGLADVHGAYTLFADGAAVGEMPRDGAAHIQVETFSFALPSAMLSDGIVDFSFTPAASDLWSLDYVEITARAVSVPVPAPGTLLLAAAGVLALLATRRRAG